MQRHPLQRALGGEARSPIALNISIALCPLRADALARTLLIPERLFPGLVAALRRLRQLQPGLEGRENASDGRRWSLTLGLDNEDPADARTRFGGAHNHMPLMAQESLKELVERSFQATRIANRLSWPRAALDAELEMRGKHRKDLVGAGVVRVDDNVAGTTPLKDTRLARPGRHKPGSEHPAAKKRG